MYKYNLSKMVNGRHTGIIFILILNFYIFLILILFLYFFNDRRIRYDTRRDDTRTRTSYDCLFCVPFIILPHGAVFYIFCFGFSFF